MDFTKGIASSRTSQEVRGLKYGQIDISMHFYSRTSQEVRGLKSGVDVPGVDVPGSHLARGAWIEIRASHLPCKRRFRRTSQEVRGLKFCRLIHTRV